MIHTHGPKLAHDNNTDDFKGAATWCYRFMKPMYVQQNQPCSENATKI
jgi:hypothetical protein